MPEPTIRRAESADAEPLVEIGIATFCETFGHLYPDADLKDYLAQAYDLTRTRIDLADPRKAAWLVEAEGKVVGYAQAGPCDLPHGDVTPACGELKRFYLMKAWQGTGVGRALFEVITAWLQAGGPRTVWIGVWSENHGAQRFYVREGFEKVGEYGFKVGQTLDLEFILRRTAAQHAGAGVSLGAAR